jgi:3-methylcrotonyl-CoA carboxylase alpha subunit
MQHLVTIGEDLHRIWLVRRADGLHLTVGEEEIPVSGSEGPGGRLRLTVGGRTVEAVIVEEGDDIHIHLDGVNYHCRLVDPVRHFARHHGASAEDSAAAPMPGTVVSVAVEAGQAVTAGQTLLVIESMKLETAVKAWRDGVVTEVHVAVGRSFDRSAPLVTLAPEGEA